MIHFAILFLEKLICKVCKLVAAIIIVARARWKAIVNVRIFECVVAFIKRWHFGAVNESQRLFFGVGFNFDDTLSFKGNAYVKNF
jgi:hypothetical protein